VFTRSAALAGAAALSLACSSGPEQSPFFIVLDPFSSSHGPRPGEPLDDMERFLRARDDVREYEQVWDRCDPLAGGARRCTRSRSWRGAEDVPVPPDVRWDVVAAADGRVVYLALAHPLHAAFDDSVNFMTQRWVRRRGVRLHPGDVSDSHPYGIAEMRAGRWRALFTHAGKLCKGTEKQRYCATLIQLVDWRDGRQYADMREPRAPSTDRSP
jgi:hypothetical protein